MFKIVLENRDFRKSLYFYIVDAASGCWHYIKSRANIKWTLEKIWAAGTSQRPDIYLTQNKINLFVLSGHGSESFAAILNGVILQKNAAVITAAVITTHHESKLRFK